MVENSAFTSSSPPPPALRRVPNWLDWLMRAAGAALVVAALFGLQWILRQNFNLYILQVIAIVGVNIILAVSLNLINGVTGQFSLGHAGFMAVGAYSAAAFSVYAKPYIALPDGIIFALALLVGASVSGVSGLLVGLPSLRLRGDYLAIVTLGFNQIIISILQNADVVGGATGFNGLPQYNAHGRYAAILVWIFALVILPAFCACATWPTRSWAAR